ncbi:MULTISPECIES: ATP-binding protein [unclassified Moraxella]|uniref:ATP-binding protein n=1 Tax=unclassified Moraxella TaxID=2685852 RepID=UPI003AF9E30E
MTPHLPKLKGYSHTWQTTLMVLFMVVASVLLSLWFFWRSLYLPELQNHATYLANQLLMLDKADKDFHQQPQLKQWVIQASHIEVITDPNAFPVVEQKTLIGHFTDSMATQIETIIGRPAKVYFKFKPVPILYVQDSAHPEFWLQEPVKFYSQYSTSTLILFLVGIPFVTILTILFLVRQLNRPLKRLQKTALDYITLGHANNLPTNEGSTEIRQVNLAFNRLFHNLTQTQKERNIMLAGISHDLRTPLTRMRLTAEMLPDEFLKEGLVYDIEDMDAILEQFISFMKDGSDEAVRLTDLRPIINEIVVQFAPLAFVVEVDEDLPNIPLRPLSIKRLIVNLVNNANRYGKPPIHIHVSINTAEALVTQVGADETDLHSVDILPQQRWLQIRVSDEGEGVAEDQLERIMQPFERGETARTTQGSGLGLAIVSRIAHLHNGKVIARNQPNGGGLEVMVSIPIVD